MRRLRRFLWEIAPIAPVLAIAMAIMFVSVRPAEPEPTPPMPRGAPPVVEEPLELAPVVTECRLRLSREETLKLVERCIFVWGGYPRTEYSAVTCFPREYEWVWEKEFEPMWEVGLDKYRHKKPGMIWQH